MSRKRRLRRGSNDDWSMWLLNEDDLEDAQEMLWRGHCPARYVRHDLEVYPQRRWLPHHSPQELKAIEAEALAYRLELEKKRAEHWQQQQERQAEIEQRWRVELEQRWQGIERSAEQLAAAMNTFRCERCKRVFRSPISDAEAEAEFLATFGVPRPADCLAVCEPCFEVLMATRT